MSRERNTLLNRYTASVVQIRKGMKKAAFQSWESTVRRILENVSSYDKRFKFDLFPTGSYFDRLKVQEPNEFDLTLIMKDLELGKDPPYDGHEDGLQDPPIGFTRVMIDQGEEHYWNQEDAWINRQGLLNASNVKSVFATLVSQAIRDLDLDSVAQASHGLAVTLEIKPPQLPFKVSIDLAPAIRDSSWPEDASEWLTRPRQGWPSPDLIASIKQDGCFLVAKHPTGNTGRDAPFFWYYSFTNAEKRLFRKGEQGDPSSCRKNVLRIMKALRQQYELTTLTSYHLKTIMLYEYESKPNQQQWTSDQVWARFQDAMNSLLKCLKERKCPHYFMREFDLFQNMSARSCSDLDTWVSSILQNPEKNIKS